MMKMGPKTKIDGTCQGPSSGGVDVAPLKAVEPHPFLPPALPRRPREARWRTRKVASTSACSTKRGRCGAQGGVGFECGHVDRGWPDLGIELPPLAPASRRPTPDLACARREGQGSAEQKGGRGGGARSHADEDRARWGRRKQGCREARTRTTPLWKVRPIARRPSTRRRQTSGSRRVSGPYVITARSGRLSLQPLADHVGRSKSELSGDSDGRRPTGAEARVHMPHLQVLRGGPTACASALAASWGDVRQVGISLRHTAIIRRIYKSRGKTRRS